MGKSKRAAPAAEPLADSAVDAVEAAVRRDGAIARSALGVPKAQAPAAVAALEARGLEATKRHVRVPVREQLAARLADAGLVALRGIEHAVAGATKKEATVAADALVAEGRAVRVVRSKEIVLAQRDAAALGDAELDALDRAIASLGAALKLARKTGASLLAADVAKALAPCTPAPAAAPPARAPAEVDLASLVERHRESTGLTFVPKIVRALGGASAREAVHDALLRGAREGRYELRPESGMGRLSEEDLGLCIPGPQGSRLSWVRRIEVSG